MILADFAEAVVAKKPNTLLTSSSNLKYMKDNMKLECYIKWYSGLLKSWHFSCMIEYAKILPNKEQHSGWRIDLFAFFAKYGYVSWLFSCNTDVHLSVILYMSLMLTHGVLSRT